MLCKSELKFCFIYFRPFYIFLFMILAFFYIFTIVTNQIKQLENENVQIIWCCNRSIHDAYFM